MTREEIGAHVSTALFGRTATFRIDALKDSKDFPGCQWLVVIELPAGLRGFIPVSEQSTEPLASLPALLKAADEKARET